MIRYSLEEYFKEKNNLMIAVLNPDGKEIIA
jgi:hypothetical protein